MRSMQTALYFEPGIIRSCIHASTHPVHLPVYNYSPNNLLTRLSTVSFSGSYGWSFDGISSREGKAAV
jgi:hypothetical protein